MKQIHKLSVLLVCLSLAACQAPTNLVGTSLGPKPDIAKSTIILDEKYVDDFNQGLFQNCLDDGKKSCDLSEFLLLNFSEFKQLFEKAVKSHSMSHQVAFKLLFLALLNKKEDAVQYLANQGVLLNKKELGTIETEGLFYLHQDATDSSVKNNSPLLTDFNLNSKTATQFAEVSLDTFQELLEHVAADARADFLQDMIYFAAASGNLSVLKFLVQQGVDVQLGKASPERSLMEQRPLPPLYYALIFWQPETSRYLIQNGARINMVFLQSTSELQNASSISSFSPYQDNSILNQLIYDLADHKHKNVKQIMEILLNEPILKSKDSPKGVGKGLQRDLLSVAAGYPNDKPDLDGLKYLLDAGVRSFGSIQMQLSSKEIPTPLNQIIKQDGPLADKKTALDLLLKYDPELNLRHATFSGDSKDIEFIDYLTSQLTSLPKEREAFLEVKSKILSRYSNLIPEKKDSGCQVLKNLFSAGNSFSTDGKIINDAIENTDCSDEMVLKLADESNPISLVQDDLVNVLMKISGYRSELLLHFLENKRYSQNPKDDLQVILNNLDQLLSFDIPTNSANPTKVDVLNHLLEAREKYLPTHKLALKSGFVWKLFPSSSAIFQPEYSHSLDVFLKLIESVDSFSLNSKDAEWGPVIIFYADHFGILKHLIEHGADINVTKNFAQQPGNPPRAFQPMRQNVYESALSYIGEFSGVLTNAVNIPFFPDQAIQNITYLLSKNPDFTLSDHADLLYAAVNSTIFNGRSGDLRLLQYILSHVSESQRKLLLQDELLLYAIMVSTGGQPVERAVYVEKFLLEQGLNMEVHNRNYETPLILAAKNKFENMYQLLLKAGANPNSRDVYGRSAKEIHDAAMPPSPVASATAIP